MKKYFRITMRIMKEVSYNDKYIIVNEDTIYVDMLYVGDGVISLDDYSIEGYIGNDYLKGEIGEELFALIIFNYDNEEESCFGININKEDVTFPGQYFLTEYDNNETYAILEVGSKIKKEDISLLEKDIEKTKELCSEIFLF